MSNNIVPSKKYVVVNDKKYFYDRIDAEIERKSGEKIYFTKGLGYYITSKY